MVDLIPRSVLFGNPERTSPQISPDGNSLAWIAPGDGAAARPVTEDTDRGIRTFGWAHDGRHLLYVQDVGGDENWRLYDVDPESPPSTDGPASWGKPDLTTDEGIQARVIATRKSHRDEVLVGLNRDNPQLHDVYRLDLKTGELAKL